VLLEEEREKDREHRERMIMEAETRAMYLEAKECQRLLATSEPTRKHGPASTLDPSEKTQPH